MLKPLATPLPAGPGPAAHSPTSWAGRMPEFEGPSRLTCWGGFLPTVPVDEGLVGPGAYEDVADGAQSGGLGKSDNLGSWGHL